MKSKALVLVLLAAYIAILPAVQSQLKQRSVVVKLGYTPSAEVLKIAANEHRYSLAAWTVLKVLFYYGSLSEQQVDGKRIQPEYLNMYETLKTTLKLDPYNMDAYYFAQSAFTWEIGRVKEVNSMLDYGMKYRTWDWYLPFFAGFNEAYFLKNYAKAAEYMRKAAQLSGSSLYTNLAARFFFEAGATDFGILFLNSMIADSKDPALKKTYQLRRDALAGARVLEQAVQAYVTRFGSSPQKLADLVASDLLTELPVDPYGGTFYLDESGKIRSTSKFAFVPGRENNATKK